MATKRTSRSTKEAESRWVNDGGAVKAYVSNTQRARNAAIEPANKKKGSK